MEIVRSGCRQWLDIKKDEASLPTELLESVLITSLIAAFENRDVATVDIAGAFLQPHKITWKNGWGVDTDQPNAE
jgi:hypothetical protein